MGSERTDKLSTEIIPDPERSDRQMGQRQLKSAGLSAAGRRRLKQRLKHYSNRLRRRHSRQIIDRQLQEDELQPEE